MSGHRGLRVCIVLPKLDLGGAEVQVLNQIRLFDRSAVEVSLCCLSHGNARMETEARQYVVSLFNVGFRWRFFPFGLLRLVRHLRRGRFDVVHCHMPPADSVGRLAGWLAGVPVRITTEHGRGLWKSRSYVFLEKILNRITDLKICVSKDILELRAMREGTPRAKLEYLPNGVDVGAYQSHTKDKAEIMAEFGWGPVDPLILSLGRLVAEKNYPLLVESIVLVREKFPTVRCIIAGEGGCRDEIAGGISNLGAGENVKLAGIRSDVPDLLHAADVYVLSSMREGFPVSLIEAMAAGCAVAAARVGGIPDAIVDGVNGVLVNPGDAAELARAIENLVRDGELRERLGAAALDDVRKRFSLEHVVRRTERIYFELAGRKAGAQPADRRKEQVSAV
jgi:glycosyltransferase involved in cell wall biosynthesis